MGNVLIGKNFVYVKIIIFKLDVYYGLKDFDLLKYLICGILQVLGYWYVKSFVLKLIMYYVYFYSYLNYIKLF